MVLDLSVCSKAAVWALIYSVDEVLAEACDKSQPTPFAHTKPWVYLGFNPLR